MNNMLLQPKKLQALQELKKKLLFVLLAIFVYRLGSHIPVPGISPEKLANFFELQKNGILGLLNIFSGGALLRVTIFALGIMPYISASIIVQLLAAVMPQLEALKKEGESGRRKLTQYSRYLTLILSIVQGIGITNFLIGQGLVDSINHTSFYFISVLTLVAGTIFLMWLGEQVTEKGFGNGISILIFVSIVSRFPSAAAQIFQNVKEGQIQFFSLIAILAIIIGATFFVVFVERAQRRIAVNYAQRNYGKKQFSTVMQKMHLPFKINMAGVIPPIFASSIIIVPGTVLRFFSHNHDSAILTTLSSFFNPGSWPYIAMFSIAIIFFSFFYNALVFNSKETADNLKKSGAFLQGIRPGEQTAKYIDGVITRLTLAGAAYLIIVSVLPELIINFWHIPFYFGGTSLLIVVVVIMDFMTQLQTYLLSFQYDSFMKKQHK